MWRGEEVEESVRTDPCLTMGSDEKPKRNRPRFRLIRDGGTEPPVKGVLS